MKTRLGFVSNSSSCSFLIYGLYLDDKYVPNGLQTWKYVNELEKKVVGKRIQVVSGYDSTYLGLSWDGIKDNETGAQFKETIRREAREILGTDIPDSEFGTKEEAWRDG